MNSKSASAPKAKKGAKEWTPEEIGHWLTRQLDLECPVAPAMPPDLYKLHQYLDFQNLQHDPTPLPVNPLQLPLLP